LFDVPIVGLAEAAMLSACMLGRRFSIVTFAPKPPNSVARQLVFSEVGRGVETTIAEGEVVMFERRITTIDEAALRGELPSLMPAFRRDFAKIAEANQHVVPYLLALNDQLKSHASEINRCVPS
jgi:5-methylthioadenosine/S-adenosylhomocysteine deaminase